MADTPSRGRILVIDDSETTRYVFRRILTRAGFEVEEAETGREGLAKAMFAPDLIIADVNLPDMLGYDVCRRLKSNPLTVSIPVLQISASFISDESRVQALEGGADSYLTQPVEPPVLLASVNALLRLRKAEAMSRLSALQWQTTFDSLSDGLALADADGIIVRANGRFMQMLTSAPSELEGVALSAVFEAKFDSSFDDFRQQQLEGLATELAYDNRWLRVRYDVVQPDQQNVSGSVLILTDITDQKKLQETLKLSERLAATGRLAHIIAHEINNPLEAMSNLLYLAAQSTQVDPEAHGYIQQASNELLRISRITKQVLAYHRESKQPVSTSANEMLEGVLAMFRAHVGGMGVELATKLACDAHILVHPGEIRQVFSNMISNALDALATITAPAPWPCKVWIRCFPVRDERRNVLGVRFVFSDNGPGIAANAVPHVFDAFYTTKEARGSGIGLWISSEVVTKHHGRIRLRTRTEGPYRGTLFDVFLPLTPEA
ncbi:MAG TPA: response regulator [Acidobacteriaceae bacterium]|jgi:PAS domain S-box-containing protein